MIPKQMMFRLLVVLLGLFTLSACVSEGRPATKVRLQLPRSWMRAVSRCPMPRSGLWSRDSPTAARRMLPVIGYKWPICSASPTPYGQSHDIFFYSGGPMNGIWHVAMTDDQGDRSLTPSSATIWPPILSAFCLYQAGLSSRLCQYTREPLGPQQPISKWC